MRKGSLIKVNVPVLKGKKTQETPFPAEVISTDSGSISVKYWTAVKGFKARWMPPANTSTVYLVDPKQIIKVLEAPSDIKMSGQRVLYYTLKDFV